MTCFSRFLASAIVLLLMLNSADAAVWRNVVVQAGETQEIKAGSDETVDILFSDGTSVILGPGASLKINEFTYDPSTGKGSLSLNLNGGQARISGGRLNDRASISIATPEATFDLEAGSAMITSADGQTTGYLLNGKGLTASAGGKSERVFRPEFGVVANQGGLGEAKRISPIVVASDLEAFSQDGKLVLAAKPEPEQQASNGQGTAGNAGGASSRPVSNTSNRPSQQSSATTGAGVATGDDTPLPTDRPDIGDLNAGVVSVTEIETIVAQIETIAPQTNGATQTTQTQTTTPAQTPSVNPPVQTTPAAPPPVPFGDGFGDFAGGDAYQPVLGMAPAAVNESNSSIVNGNYPQRWQEFRVDQPGEAGDPAVPRNYGPTSNKIFQSTTLTESLGAGAPSSYGVANGGLSYFDGTGAFGIKLADGQNTFDEQALFLLGEPADGRDSTSSLNNREFGSFEAETTLGPNTGVFVETLSFGILGGGRDQDNFFYAEMLPGDITIFDLTTPAGTTPFDQAVAAANGAGLQVLFGPREINGGDPANGRIVLTERANDPTRIIFAAGDLDAAASRAPAAQPSVDSFFVAPGLTDAVTFAGTTPTATAGSDLASGERAFLRGETWTGLDGGLAVTEITDPGLLVVNPTGDPLTTPAPFLHADFGFSDDGTTQFSTISATIGAVTYRTSMNPGQPADPMIPIPAITEVDAIASGATVGSSRSGAGSTLLSGPVRSTASGGGNSIAGAGFAGFFVFENAGLAFDDVATPNPDTLPGGVEQPLGNADPDVGFAIGRLAVATQKETPTRTFDGMGSLTGYAGGLLEVETGTSIGLQPFADPSTGPNFTMENFDLAANTFTATANGDGVTVSFGGAGASAWADDQRFGARTADGNMTQNAALVSGDLIAPGLAGQFESGDGGPVMFVGPGGTPTDEPGDYDHIKWGYFFGDLDNQEGSRIHQHLGTFVAGSPVDIADLNSATGTATYHGHIAGDVYDSGNLRSVVGSFRETFNFSSRTGATRLDFDRRIYTNPAGTPSTLVGQAYNSTVVSGDITGNLNGRFVLPLNAGGRPTGLVGGFRLQNQATDPATAYRATGGFGGSER